MPEADTFEAPQGSTFHGELLEAVTEAFVGNGVLADGEAYVSADSGVAMGVDVSAAPSGVSYAGSVYTPPSASFTLAQGPTTTTGGQDDRRVDSIVFDAASGTFAKLDGAADPNPTPPPTPADGLLIALCLIPHGATDLSDANILNWRARPQAGSKTAGGEAEFEEGLHVGVDPADTISETASPTGFSFTAGDERDVWLEVDVTVSNSSGASATEDVTATLYDGTDSTGTQVATDTAAGVTVADGASTTVSLIATDQNLDGGDYYVDVTTSGTDLSVDQTDAKTKGLTWSFVENDDGTLDLTNRYTGNSIFTVDPFTDEIAFLNAAIDEPEIADGSITTPKIADDAVTVAKIAANAVTNEQMADDAITDVEMGVIASGFTGATNAGSFGALFDFPVDGGSADNSLHNYTFAIDGTDLIEFRALSDGAGGVDTLEVRLHQTTNLNGNDIVDGGTTVWSSTDGYVPRSQVDDELVTATVQSANYTTAGEEVIPVDPSTTGGVTVTLATADTSEGNVVQVLDVGGTSESNPITIATEGTQTIDGQSTVVVDHGYGSVAVISDGSNWFTRHKTAKPTDPRQTFEGTETGNVPATSQGVLVVDNVAEGETVSIYKAALTTDTVAAAPTGVNLELVTFDNLGGYATQATVVSGDGSTIHDRVTGNPVASYTNSSGAAQSVGVIVDNTTASAIDIVAKVEGIVPV